MMENKKFYMQFGDENPKQQDKEKEEDGKIKENITDEIQDEIFDSLFQKMEILDMSGSGITLKLPLELVKLLSSLFKGLDKQIEGGIER